MLIRKRLSINYGKIFLIYAEPWQVVEQGKIHALVLLACFINIPFEVKVYCKTCGNLHLKVHSNIYRIGKGFQIIC